MEHLHGYNKQMGDGRGLKWRLLPRKLLCALHNKYFGGAGVALPGAAHKSLGPIS